MDRYRESTSAFFTGLAHGLRRKLRLTADRSPAPQTSLIFELPNELILSVLSHISPDPQHTGHYFWSYIQRGRGTDDFHQQRVRFLRPLSMTCRAMRLRLLPWVWERLEIPWQNEEEDFARKLNTITNTLRADAYLTTSVKFMAVRLTRDESTFPPFVKCLKSLSNLHTLEVGWADDFITTPLENALKGVKLPQIKALILPPAAYPLLQHCRDVEDVFCVVKYKTTSSHGFLRSLASNRHLKIKRLAIPLALWDNSPQFVAACPRLTELTIISPYPYGAQSTGTGIQLDLAKMARSAILGVVAVCKTLPDCDTIQFVRFPIVPRPRICLCDRENCYGLIPSLEEWGRVMEQTKDLEDWTIDCLKPKTGCQEGGEKRITLRVFGFSPDRPCQSSVEVGEFEV